MNDAKSDQIVKLRAWLPLLLIAVAFLVRINTLGNEFVWDDRYFLFEQEAVQEGAGPAQWFGTSTHGLYRPVRSMFYALTTSVFDQNILGYRLVAIGLDALMALLIFWLLRRLFGATGAFFGSLVWLVHPMHVERIAFITASHDIVGLAFMLAVLIFALRIGDSDDRQTGAWIGLIAASFFAVFGSEEALLLPAYFLLLAIVHRGWPALKTRHVRASLALMIVACAVYLAVRVVWIGLLERSDVAPVESGGQILPVMLAVFWFYFSSTFAPVFMRATYPPFTFTGLAHPVVLAGGGVLIGLLIAAVLGLRKRSWVGLAAGWWLVALLLFSNLLPNVAQRHDRYLYIPTIALAMAVAAILRWVQTKKSARFTAAVILCLVLAATYFAVSLSQNRVWKNELSLWGYAHSGCPNCSKPAINFGIALAKAGQSQRAREVLAPVLVPKPGYEMAFVAMASIEMDEGRRQNALQLLSFVLDITPGFGPAVKMQQAIANAP